MGLFDRLKKGLGRSSKAIGEGIGRIFTSGRLDDTQLATLEEILITADLGFDATANIIDKIKQRKIENLENENQLKEILAEEITSILEGSELPLALPQDKKPAVILMAGVNGAGKTTTIGKLAQKFKQQGQSVMLAAGDTFRAAAIEQLEVWGERAGVPVISGKQGADAAGLVYSALEQARAEQVDILIVDTAGRLQSNEALMAELEKITRVMRKLDDSAPHASLLVLDATVGQNAISQAQAFLKAAGTTGLIMTKLDGTARGGVLVALTRKLGLPIHYIGVGESAEDLQPFQSKAFARALTGLDS